MKVAAKNVAFAGALLTASFGLAGAAQAQADCPNGMRKLNVGVSVTPPNVVHTTPFVAKKLGFFAKHCIDANIVEFEGGAAGTAITAVAQGTVISNLPSAAIAQGVKGKEIWGLAPRPPQSYVVAESIKTASDLKGRRLSAAGGIGGFNWLIGRDVLASAGLTVNDAQFISQGTAGRLPGLLTGQLDGVVLHPEDTYLALQKKPGLHVLMSITDLMPKFSFNSYGASDALIARDRPLLVDAVAAMIEANRTIYREKEKVIPIMVEATQKPREAVEYAWDDLTRKCVWSVNTGQVRERVEWMMQRDIEVGDVDPGKKLGYDQIVDEKLAQEAVDKAGGAVTINGCKD